MKKSILKKEQISSYDYQSRTSKYYLEKIESHILESFNPEQIQAITFALEQAISKSSPKLVDLRFVVDSILFYLLEKIDEKNSVNILQKVLPK